MRFRLRVAAIVLVAVISVCAVGCSRFSPDLPPHLIPVGEATPVRPVDGREPYTMSPLPDKLDEAAYRARMDELYSAVVYDGLRPIFRDNDPAEAVYTAARRILDRYVSNEWHGSADGEYNIVHAVHDCLAYYVDYDFELYDAYKNGATALSSDPAFHIDGVFLHGKAVCDGLSRAFEFLCALEGISSVRVTGSLASVPHAWNKVRIGGKWYNVDVTAAAAHYSVGGGEYRKQLSHGYFLLSDKTYAEFKAQSHVFAEQPFVATEDYDYYGGEQAEIGGETFPLVVTSRDGLTSLFEAVRKADKAVGKLEVRLDYGGYVQVNAADMYRDDIAAAYAALGNSDFRFHTDSVPYFRYPNGVYLFLFYY